MTKNIQITLIFLYGTVSFSKKQNKILHMIRIRQNKLFQILLAYIIKQSMNSSQQGNSQIRYLGSTYLYNMLQDFRHLLIFDFREDFNQINIRDSFHIYPGLNREKIIEVIDLAEKKANEKQQKYKNIQKIRRYFFIDCEKVDLQSEGVKFVMKCLMERQSKQDKFYALNDSFENFSKAYPFVLVDDKKLKEAAQKSQQEFDKAVLYPYAKFPAQIIPGKLYLGNIYSSNSQKQLGDMGIVTLIDFIDYGEEQKVAEFKNSHQSYHHWPFNKDVPVNIDFDVLNKQIDELLNKGKVLLYCKDGETISPAFAISYLMYKAKLDVSTATLKVCQAISRVEINKMIYTQLLIYKPKK